MHTDYYIGIMSGTSCDGIDTALTRIKNKKIQLINTHYTPFTAELKQDILDLCSPGHNAIERLGHCDNQLGHLYAKAVLHILNKQKLSPKHIRAVGCHGQTIRHQPNHTCPYSIQIGDPNHIAATTGIDTVADFRRRDIVLGGQGAPLMPAFHAALIPPAQRPAWIINIGGMSNITRLTNAVKTRVSGYDIGPGNILLDTHFQRHHPNQSFDKNGSWASRGKVQPVLLQQMLNDNYFARPAPKSTGREYFNAQWLDQQIKLFNH